MSPKKKQPAPGSARVRNETHRPCSFQCGGSTVRLGPGEDVDVPEAWLGTLELLRLERTGRITVTARSSVEKPRLHETPVSDLDDALSRVHSIAVLKDAMDGDDRKTATPKYEARIAELEKIEEASVDLDAVRENPFTAEADMDGAEGVTLEELEAKLGARPDLLDEAIRAELKRARPRKGAVELFKELEEAGKARERVLDLLDGYL